MKEKTGRDRILQLFDDLDTSKLLATTKYRTACNQCSNTQAEAIAARDKWWIKEMELHHDFTALGHTPPQMHFIFSEPEWQSLKQSLEVKA